MTPLPFPPPQYLMGVTAEQAEAARRFLAEALRHPIRAELKPYETLAVTHFAHLTGIVEAARAKEEDGG